MPAAPTLYALYADGPDLFDDDGRPRAGWPAPTATAPTLAELLRHAGEPLADHVAFSSTVRSTILLAGGAHVRTRTGDWYLVEAPAAAPAPAKGRKVPA